ncbi:MAG: hypothetical protein O3B95_00740 [Chloroflexi bacterium]|nr:hypothetical protein [Chloroflexota bacterium]
MKKLIGTLKALNRKERYFLIADALGNQDFRLGEEFRLKLGRAANVEIPAEVWVAMDYHLDWLSAALHVSALGLNPAIPWENTDVVKGNQEDVDLIVGFDTPDNTTLILIEAKLDTAWSNNQMNSKAERLRTIFGQVGSKYHGVSPIVVFTSPNEPKDLQTSTWPSWMVVDGKWRWMPLELTGGRRRLYRSDANGRSSANAGYAVIR